MTQYPITTLPYCLECRADGKYVVVNRYYKHLGSNQREWEDYESLQGHDLRLTPKDAERISHKHSSELQKLYLYGDGSIPWLSTEARDAYVSRLEKLSKLGNDSFKALISDAIRIALAIDSHWPSIRTTNPLRMWRPSSD